MSGKRLEAIILQQAISGVILAPHHDRECSQTGAKVRMIHFTCKLVRVFAVDSEPVPYVVVRFSSVEMYYLRFLRIILVVRLVVEFCAQKRCACAVKFQICTLI